MSTSTNPPETQMWMRKSKELLHSLSKSVDETKEIFALLEVAFGVEPPANEDEENEAVRVLGGVIQMYAKSVVASCENAAKLRDVFPELAKVAGLKMANVAAAGGLPPPPPAPEPTGPRVPSFAEIIRMVDTETNQAKNLGIVDAIRKMTAPLGIKDPTVVFIGPNDKYTCEECKRLFFTDGVNPRPWKMSELKQGDGKRGDLTPSLGHHLASSSSNCHQEDQECRHCLASVLPGYGFKNGSSVYIEPGYDYYAECRKRFNKE
jgi:hypothetical protein